MLYEVITQAGLERGERVVRDPRPRPRQTREQRRLAGVGQPHQADVRQQHYSHSIVAGGFELIS